MATTEASRARSIAAALTALPMRAFDDLTVKAMRPPPKEHGFYA